MTDSAVTARFDGLFDDAALFPPGDATMAMAVPAHPEPTSRLGGLVGPFVVPAARLDELVAEPEDGERFPISLIGSAGAPASAALLWLREDDGTALAETAGSWSPGRATRARAAFTSVGTCSVLDPVDDLVGFGLLPTSERIPA